jgi:gliding motility-associated lipoprotein GldH
LSLFLHKQSSLKNAFLFLLAACSLQLAACSCSFPSDVFEKDVAIPGQQWESSFKPRIDFTIKDQDTTALYNIYLVLRHSDAYNYNNIWVQGTVRQPGDTATKTQRYDLTLATNDKGWLGSGMDDIYEQRILIQPETKFRRPGTYSFMLEQIMREDPLKHVLNVGVRVEKAK